MPMTLPGEPLQQALCTIGVDTTHQQRRTLRTLVHVADRRAAGDGFERG